MSDAVWKVYMLRCSDGSLYTGVTTDTDRRVREHNGDGRGGARYTSGRRPVALAWEFTAESQSDALKIEWQLKSIGKIMKEQLVAGELVLFRDGKRGPILRTEA